MSDLVLCLACGKRFPAHTKACPTCGEPNVWLSPAPASMGRFVLGVLTAVLVAALLALLWAVSTVTAP